MSSRDEYSHLAAECLTLARNMGTGKAHWLLVEMARVWMLLADAADLVTAPSTTDPVQPTVQQQQQRQPKSDRDNE